MYASTFNESIFSPCEVPGIGSGWSLRFTNPRDGAFLRYGGAGMATLTHFVRVRGRVSAPGHYGLGFQTREIVVDSVLDMKETEQPCPSYEDLPQPWDAIEPRSAPIVGVAVTDDKAMVAVMDREGIISVWNTRRGALVKDFPSDDKGNLAGTSRAPLVFTHDGKRLAAGGIDGVVRVWNPVSGERIWTFAATDTMPGEVNGRKVVASSQELDFNQSGTLLANTVFDKTAIWSTVSGTRLGTFKEGWWTAKLRFTGDSSFIASGDSGLMKVYPRVGSAPVWRIRTPARQFQIMERSSDGRWLFVKGSGDTAYLWSLSDGQLAHKITLPNWFGIGAIAFSPDGNTIATAAGANGLYLWDTKTGQPLRSFQKFRTPVVKAWFTADGRSIVGLPMWERALHIVHLDPRRGEPVQAWWGANSRPPPTTSGASLGSISGFVRDSAKKAIVGAEVSIFDGSRPGSAPIAQTSTNAAGRFLFQGVMVPHVTVRAAKRGFATDVRYAHMSWGEVSADVDLRADPRGASGRR